MEVAGLAVWGGAQRRTKLTDEQVPLFLSALASALPLELGTIDPIYRHWPSALIISAKAVTFVENLNDMAEYTFEMVPQMVGRIAELLTSIDQKLDKLTVPVQPVDDTPELMTVKDLGKYLPSHPAPSTVYGWIRDNTIPYYKQGKTLVFKKSEIDKWMLSTRVKDDGQLQEEAEEWCRTHPLGWRHRQ